MLYIRLKQEYIIELQKYLKQQRDINILTKKPYSLKIKKDKGLTLFKYSQFDSNFDIQLVREARGIIFDKEWNLSLIHI